MARVPRIHSFTTRFSGITSVLITDVHIAESFSLDQNASADNLIKLKAIWDTGATNSAITQRVVDECKLNPIGMTRVSTPAGQSECPTFLVAMGLPNNILFNQVRVTLGQLSGDVDVLIGMEIIQQGDFVITNRDRKTVFSFRIPSVGLIDFVEDGKHQKISRNAPCPCGSGQKYKRCHGKR